MPRALLGSVLTVAAVLACLTPVAIAQTTTTVKPGTASCARGDALLAAGYVDDAEAVFKLLLGTPCEAGSGDADPAARLAEIKGTRAGEDPRAKAIGVIEALQIAGFETEARAKLQKLIESDPGAARDLPYGVRSIGQRLGWWRTWLGRIGPPARTAAEILAALLAVAVLVVATGKLAGRRRRSLRVTGVSGSKDDQTAAQLGGALQSALVRLHRDAADGRLLFVGASEGTFDIPATIATVAPQAKLLAELLTLADRLFWRRLDFVSATVCAPDAERGVGLIVSLSARSGELRDQVTVWERDFGLPTGVAEKEDLTPRYARLAVPAAVWIAYRTSGHELEAPLGTDDWRSYATFSIAPDDAAALRAALDIDPANHGAQLNLGALLLHTEEADEPPEDTRRRLRTAGELIGLALASADDPERSLWYRARYLAAIHAMYDGRPAHARNLAGELDREIRAHGGDRPTLRGLLRSMDDANRVLLASARLRLGEPTGIEALLARRPRSASTEYNLACFYSRKREWRSALDHLDAAIETTTTPEEMRRWARTDPVLQVLTTKESGVAPAFARLTRPRTETAPEATSSAWRSVGRRLRRLLLTPQAAARS